MISREEIKQLLDAGLNVFPVNRNHTRWDKHPQAVLLPLETELKDAQPSIHIKGQKRTWNYFRENKVNELWLNYWAGRAEGMAVVAGPISGNIMCLDFDLKNHPNASHVWEHAYEGIIEIVGINNSLLIQQTKSGWYHIIFRVDGLIPKVGKIAHRYLNKDEKGYIEGKKRTEEFIEVRRTGQYFIIAPTEGYKIVEGSIDDIQVLHEDKVDEVISFLSSLTEITKEIIDHKETKKSTYISQYETSPWAAYNKEDHWKKILIENGWTETNNTDRKTNTYWKRPGTDNAWSASWDSQLRLFYVFSPNSPFDADKGYTPQAIRTILDYDGNFSECTKQLLKEGYGDKWKTEDIGEIRSLVSLKDIHRTFQEMIEQSRPDETDERKKKLAIAAETLYNFNLNCKFWNITQKGQIIIDKSKLRDFVKNELSILVIPTEQEDNQSDYIIAHINGHFVKPVNIFFVKNLVFTWLRTNEDNYQKIESILIGFSDNAWKNVIEAIDKSVITFLRDTNLESYHFFKNKYVTIDMNGWSSSQYSQLNEELFIWESQVIDFNFSLDKETKNTVVDRYINRVAGLPEGKDPVITKNQDVLSFQTVIGYLCTNYKTKSRAYAIVMSEDTEKDGEGGGTGKSLLMEFIKKIRKVVMLDGKVWKPDQNFAYQRIEHDTDIMAIDDITKYWKVSSMYNVITGDLTIEKKNQKAYVIPFEHSPKPVFITNYEVIDDTVHMKRRVRRIFFQKFFNENMTPDRYFGKRLFDDWSETEWNEFYNTMFRYISIYLKNGIAQATESNAVILKKMKQKVGEHADEFITYMDYLFEDSNTPSHPVMELWKGFRDKVDDRKAIKKARFKQWVEYYCSQNNIGLEQRRTTAGDKVTMYYFDKPSSFPDEKIPF